MSPAFNERALNGLAAIRTLSIWQSGKMEISLNDVGNIFINRLIVEDFNFRLSDEGNIVIKNAEVGHGH